mgnify:CR=1 FL=1
MKTKDECEAIRYYSGYSFDTYKTCTFSGTTCSTKEKQCSEMTTEYECSSLTLSDTNKICVFTNNACKEQFKTCEAYQNSGATIDKETCESIIMESDYRKKCQFIGGRCTEAKRKCSDFDVDSIANLCYNNILPLDTKRCSYSNNACSLIYKPTCYELSYSKNATEEICSNAKTNSDYKVCGLKSDKKGCQDYSNPSPTKKTSSQSSQSSSKNGAKYLDVFAIALYCLLV